MILARTCLLLWTWTLASWASAPPPPHLAGIVPTQGGPAGYVGSEACRDCHRDAFTSWHRTFHRTMTQYPSRESVKARVEDVTLTHQGVRYRLGRSNDVFKVWLESVAGDAPAVESRLSLVTGSHHMQVFWMPGDDGNVQVGFPFTWLIPEGRWVPRQSTFIRPPGTPHSTEVWNVGCSRCHATAIEPRVDPARRTVDTRSAELGISCEACHGPGERHANARRKQPSLPQDARLPQGEIIHPAKLDAARSTETCGFCHSMKWIDRNEPWRQAGFRFRPGDSLDASTPLIRPRTADKVPGLREFLARNPGLLSEYFWPDGMIRVSGREMNGLVESKCFEGGKMSCITCHAMHDGDPDDQLHRKAQGSQACLACHASYASKDSLVRHTRHAEASPGSDCRNCHMPHTTYGVLGAIRSHQITRPSASETLEHGRPNACNLCHLDQSLAWTARQLHDAYGQPIPPNLRQEHNVAESVRLALSGDAGQRALAAWHLGWEPAVKTSGAAWIPPILGVLLDDDYAAIRCIAGRSIDRVAPGLAPGYRFEEEPDARPDWTGRVWKAWRERLPPKVALPESVRVEAASPEALAQRLASLRTARDERPVRLRE